MAAATKVVLGARPKSIKRDVTFEQIDGVKGVIPVTYVYRTRAEFADLLGKFTEKVATETAAAIAAAAEQGRSLTVSEEDEIQRRYHAEWLVKILVGWGLDVPFSPEAAEQLVDELPGGAQAIMDECARLMKTGRLGN